MDIRNSILSLAFFFFINNAFSQYDTIDSIQFEGNKRTNSNYLKRFLSVKENDSYDSISVSEDLRRFRTLSSVLDAEAELSKTDSATILKYTFNERWTLLPVGDFGLSEGNLWVGAGIMESNLFGRGVYLYGYIQYKTPFAAQIILRNPYLFGSKIGYEFQLKSFDIRDSDTEFQVDLYKQQEFSIAGKYELLFEKDILAGIAKRFETAYLEGRELDNKISYRYFLEFRFQKMDYRHFMQDGWQNNLLINLIDPTTNHLPSVSIFNELRYFKTFRKVNLAARFMGGISTEENVYYLPFIADSYRNFRGSGFRYFKGNRLIGVNLEYRQTIFENGFAGVQLIGFADFGKIGYKSDKEFSINKNLVYMGPGVRFIIKKVYNAVLSIDYGLNMLDFNYGGWVIGWGQYF